MNGFVDDHGVPRVTVPLAGREWSAIIDTGFNGDLELPEALRSAVSPELIGRFRSHLAGGQTLMEDTYFVKFPFAGETREAFASFVPGDEILIGTHLLRRDKLEIDFLAQRLTLEPADPASARSF